MRRQNLIDVFGIEALTIDQLHIYVTIVENARVMQGLDNRQIRIRKLGVLTHDGNLNLVGVVVGMVLLAQELIPCAHIALARIEAKALANAQVKVLLGEQLRHVVNARAILVGKDAVGVDVAETRDLAANGVVNMVIGAQHNNVGLDAKAAQLLDGVLRGLGLNLVGGGDIGNERYVDVADVLGTGLLAVLADSSTNGCDSMSPIVPPSSVMTTSEPVCSSMRRNLSLIALVTCGITWTVPPKKSPRRSRAIRLL